jgi:hypothetical protein
MIRPLPDLAGRIVLAVGVDPRPFGHLRTPGGEKQRRGLSAIVLRERNRGISCVGNEIHGDREVPQ